MNNDKCQEPSFFVWCSCEEVATVSQDPVTGGIVSNKPNWIFDEDTLTWNCGKRDHYQFAIRVVSERNNRGNP